MVSVAAIRVAEQWSLMSVLGMLLLVVLLVVGGVIGIRVALRR